MPSPLWRAAAFRSSSAHPTHPAPLTVVGSSLLQCRRAYGTGIMTTSRMNAAAPSTALSTSRRACTSSASGGTSQSAYDALKREAMAFPVIANPARSYFTRQHSVDPAELKRGVSNDLLTQLKATRKFYQYPSISAPKIGWNAQVFVLYDETVFVNPEIMVHSGTGSSISVLKPLTTVEQVQRFTGDPHDPAVKPCYTWEASCASPFLMYYIKRPNRVTIRALNEAGEPFTVSLDLMKARMALHEMDHMFGILFARRIPNVDHCVPLDAFPTMNEWADDWPSLEARSTYVYNIFTPPLTFENDPSVVGSDFLERKFDKRVYPGMELEGFTHPVSSEEERRHYAELWRRAKEDLAAFDVPNVGPGTAQRPGDGSQQQQQQQRQGQSSRLKEMTADVELEAERDARNAESAL